MKKITITLKVPDDCRSELAELCRNSPSRAQTIAQFAFADALRDVVQLLSLKGQPKKKGGVA